ncbi:hypothetical protein CFC21_049708 [Triticum aestivum]|uniref:Fe2OG dioxygenase domain-containing protein n=3 Tax=Triticinae TaxID=1648030 RepID=A0A453GGU0_AEGTS|nr:1-aminocyclopropane-1-carboxylate oxidase homolog 1-like [Aegilops tauschii subsp. strangulata]KAF7039760.1 hypothetical protein CFC21_049708 [Triticum aestivum]
MYIYTVNTPRLANQSMASDHERLLALTAFDDTKAGVKGLVDAGVTAVPSIFHHPPECLPAADAELHHLTIPVIDLASDSRVALVAQVKAAAQAVGFFQVVNHDVPDDLLAEMLASVRRFHESPVETKRAYYSRDHRRRVQFNSNFYLFQSPAASWRDTMFLQMPLPASEEIPEACRAVAPEYARQVQRVGRALFELLSEALGLDPSYLEEETMCLDRVNIGGHYYPACPEPHLTLGTSRHSDASLLTVLLQDTVGGLQVLVDDDKWVDVPAVPGALVVNVGDYLQLMSNNRFKSVEHRVVANSVDSRVSVACFIAPNPSSARVLAPIVTGDGAVARYRSTTVDDMFRYYRNRTKALNGTSALQHFTI